MGEPELDRDPAAHAVAGEAGALEAELVEHLDHDAGEPGGVEGSVVRLVGVTEAGQIDRDDPVAGRRQSGDRGQERGFGAAEAVQADQWRPLPRFAEGDVVVGGRDPAEAQPAGLGRAGGRGEEADAQVQVLANP